MPKKETVAIIGCTHAGTLAAIVLRKLRPDIGIIVFEKTYTVSFLSCGIHLAVQQTCTDLNSMFYSSVANMRSLGIEVHDMTEVTSVDFAAKRLTARHLVTDEVRTYGYDKLLLTMGSIPRIPFVIEGLDYTRSHSELVHDIRDRYNRICLVKNYVDAKQLLKLKNPNKVVVVGGGLIGMEIAWSFQLINARVMVIDHGERVLNKYYDGEYLQILEDQCKDLKIELITRARIISVCETDDYVQLQIERVQGGTVKVQQLQVDYVLLSMGFVPNIELVKDSPIQTHNGVIMVDRRQRTSLRDVYAAGDCCSTHFEPTGQATYIPLATHAIRHTVVAAFQLAGVDLQFPGSNGSCGVQLFNYSLAACGLNALEAAKRFPRHDKIMYSDYLYQQYCEMRVERVIQALASGPEFEARARSVRRLANALIESFDEDLYNDEDNIVSCVLHVDQKSGSLLGCQVMGAQDVSEVCNTASVLLSRHLGVADVLALDLGGMDGVKKPWGVLAMTAASRFVQLADFEGAVGPGDDAGSAPSSSTE